MNALKYRVVVRDGKLDFPIIDLPEGTIIEAILLVEAPENQKLTDDTAYLLSTEANRCHLKESLEQLKQPENYIYVDVAAL